jgi:hypothetical protein
LIEGSNRVDTIHRPIEIANLYRITHREEKLKDLSKHITYSWIYNVKTFKTTKWKLSEILLKLMKKESIEIEKGERSNKNELVKVLSLHIKDALKVLNKNKKAA